MQYVNEKYFKLCNTDVVYTENKEGLACPCHICGKGILLLEDVDHQITMLYYTMKFLATTADIETKRISTSNNVI